MEVDGSSLMLRSRVPGVAVWELMALRRSRWYGTPEVSSSAEGERQVGHEKKMFGRMNFLLW